MKCIPTFSFRFGGGIKVTNDERRTHIDRIHGLI